VLAEEEGFSLTLFPPEHFPSPLDSPLPPPDKTQGRRNLPNPTVPCRTAVLGKSRLSAAKT